MGAAPCAFGEVAMEGMASVWGYQESVEDLKHKLFCATLELESVRANAKEETRRSEENINHLILLLRITSRERDEARDQLQLLLNKIAQPIQADVCPAVQCLQLDSPPLRPTRGNSSITESDSLSGTPKFHSVASSPVESFLDAVSSPDLSNINMADSCNMGVAHKPLYITCNNNNLSSIKVQSSIPVYDPGLAIIDSLTKKVLPEDGKFLQAVMEAGPLLDGLLLAGPLPRWRNPPPLQSYQIPPVASKGHISQNLNQSAAPLIPNHLAQGLHVPMLDSSNSSSFCMKRSAMLSSVGNYQRLTPKRQKSL